MTMPNTPVAPPPALKPMSLLSTMGEKYGVDPKVLEQTVMSTVMKGAGTREQVVALLIVANVHDLNPFTREIFAFPGEGGSIVPVVSVDGWLKKVNTHPQCDGFEQSFEMAENGEPISCTTVMHRKDRSHPISHTEFFAECKRNTKPWISHPRRMLGHKSVIQAARYAFGFAGIYDEDEAEIIAENNGQPVSAAAPIDPTLTQTERMKKRFKGASEAETAPVDPDPSVSVHPPEDVPETISAEPFNGNYQPAEVSNLKGYEGDVLREAIETPEPKPKATKAKKPDERDKRSEIKDIAGELAGGDLFKTMKLKADWGKGKNPDELEGDELDAALNRARDAKLAQN